MRISLVLGAAALTSLLAIVVFRRRGLAALGAAVGALLETVGATLVFLAANVLVGGTIILVARRLWFYTTLYDMTDITLLPLSLLQAVVVTAWLRLR